MALLLDTHIWAWFAENSKKLSRSNVARIEKAASGSMMVSAVSVWELALLVHSGRMALDPNIRTWVETSVKQLGLSIISINADIALESYNLPGVFHKDPADRMIVATARQMGLTLVTQDKLLLAYAKQGYVRVAS